MSELLEILGLYYDSTEQQLLHEAQTPQTINLTINYQFKASYEEGTNFIYKSEVTSNGKIYEHMSEAGHYKSHILDILNKIKPNFIIRMCDYANIPISSQDEFKIEFNGQTLHKYSYQIKSAFSDILMHYLGSLTAIPIKFSLPIQIIKTSQPQHVRKYCAQQRACYGGMYRYTTELISCKEAADYILSHKFIKYVSKSIRPFDFKGALKGKIYQFDKEPVLFLLEYLYGIQLNKFSTYRQIGQALSETREDWQLRDCQQLIKLYKIVSARYTSIKSLYNSLVEVVKPKGDLKRWQQYIQAT